MVNARNKGARGERQASEFLSRITGRPWMRSASQARGSYAGRAQDPDVILAQPKTAYERVQGPEVKVGGSWSPLAAMRQAVRDSEGTTRVPWVLAKRDRGPWVVYVRAYDLDPFLEHVMPELRPFFEGEREVIKVIPKVTGKGLFESKGLVFAQVREVKP